jgi:VWFA-related protein
VPVERTSAFGRKRENLPLSSAIRRRLRSPLAGLSVALPIIATAVIAGPHLLRAQTSSPDSTPPGPTQAAPSATAPHSPTFTVNVRLVVLDIVVTDPSGKPVDGLTAKDFQVFEDGKPQPIRSFEPPSAHLLPPATIAAGESAVFDPAEPASFGRSPVDILVLDQLNTHFADSSFARRSLRDYLAGQPALLSQPTTLLAVDDTRFRLLHPFTRDRDAVLRALAAAPTGYAWTLEVNGNADHGPIERLDQSLRALEEIAQSYARIPGRKNLIWVGGGFPSLDPESLDGDDLQEVKDTLHHVTNVLLDTRITLYAVDPTSLAPGMTEITDASQMAFVLAAGDSLAGSSGPFNASEDFNLLGPVTGGRVVRGMNDIAHQIASSVDLGNRFYTISYTPSSSSEDAAEYRKIRVVCLRPGLTATTRSGYYSGQTQQEKSTAAATYDLTAAADSAIPLNALHITVEPDTSPNAPSAAYVVHAGVVNLTWKPKPDGSATASVYVMAVSLDAKSKMLAHTLLGMTANAKPGADLRNAARTADFHFTAPPAPRSTTLRFIVRDSATGRMGSVDLPLAKH